MKVIFGIAAVAASIAFAAPAFAQNSAPGTSVQTGAAASNSMNGNAMNGNTAMGSDNSMSNGSMAASHTMKKKKHTMAMDSSGSANGVVNKNDMSNQPGTKSNGH